MGIEKLQIILGAMNNVPSGYFFEVGTRRGGTALMAIQHDKCEHLTCVDPYKSFPDMSGNAIEMNPIWFSEAYDLLQAEEFKTKKRFDFYKCTSKEFIDFTKDFTMLKYSFVLLDGEHTNEAVKAEIEYFSRRIDIGGVLFIDNIDWLTLDFTGWEKPRYDMAYKVF